MRTTSVLEIVAVRLQDGEGHEHITHLFWQGPSSWGIAGRDGLVAWLLEDPEHELWVTDGARLVTVELLTPLTGSAQLRSRSEGRWGDHLLALPRL